MYGGALASRPVVKLGSVNSVHSGKTTGGNSRANFLRHQRTTNETIHPQRREFHGAQRGLDTAGQSWRRPLLERAQVPDTHAARI